MHSVNGPMECVELWLLVWCGGGFAFTGFCAEWLIATANQEQLQQQQQRHNFTFTPQHKIHAFVPVYLPIPIIESVVESVVCSGAKSHVRFFSYRLIVFTQNKEISTI